MFVWFQQSSKNVNPGLDAVAVADLEELLDAGQEQLALGVIDEVVQIDAEAGDAELLFARRRVRAR